MAREKLRLGIDQLGGKGFERFGVPPMQFLSRGAQQTAIGRVLHQRVLECIDRIRRRTVLKHQLGSDKPGERSLQLVLGKTADRTQ
jgi:hypothetical protein